MADDNTPSPQTNHPFFQAAAIAKYTSAKHIKKSDLILHNMIEIHRRELENIGIQLAKEAKRKTVLSSSVKATVIFLGAFVAIKEVVNQLIGSSNTANIIVFTIAGLLIAVLTGLEAAFKWENTAAQLKSLVATSRAASRKAASNITRTFATKQDQERTNELEKILGALDDAIIDIQKQAAEAGIETVSRNNVYADDQIELNKTRE